MVLNDFFKSFRGAGVIPDAFRVNHGHRSLLADAEAVRLGAEHAGMLGGGEAEFLEAVFEEFPRRQAVVFCAAFGVRLVRAEENVALDGPDAERGGAVAEVRHEE